MKYSLADKMAKNLILSDVTATKIVYQMLEGIKIIHSLEKGIVLGDIQPGSIMLVKQRYQKDVKSEDNDID
jgi:serine/threonine protein kinase